MRTGTAGGPLLPLAAAEAARRLTSAPVGLSPGCPRSFSTRSVIFLSDRVRRARTPGAGRSGWSRVRVVSGHRGRRRARPAGRPCPAGRCRAGAGGVEPGPVVGDGELEAVRRCRTRRPSPRTRPRTWRCSAAPPGRRNTPRPRCPAGTARCRPRRSRPAAAALRACACSAADQALVGQQRRVDAAGQIAQVLQRAAQAVLHRRARSCRTPRGRRRILPAARAGSSAR